MRLTQFYCLLREARLRRAGDLLCRVEHALKRRLGLLRRQFPAVTPRGEDLIKALTPGTANSLVGFARRFDERSAPAFYFDSEHARDWIGDSTAVVAAADAVVAGRYRVLGSDEFCFGDAIDWSNALSGNAHWPRKHWTEIDFRSAGPCGDVKRCWQWNRHYQFVTLGRAWRHTHDDRYVDAFVRLLTRWCDQNPPEIGVHYASNLEIGVRCMSWLWAHQLMAPSPRYSIEARGQFHLFLYCQARHLAAHIDYTRHTGRNNHLVGDASCLAVIALMYPELRQAQSWLEKSLQLLWESLDEQVLADGMHFELSPGYHLFTTECYLQVILLMQRQGRETPERVISRVSDMLEVVAALRQPNGELPNFNDCDEGSAWALHDTPCERVEQVLARGVHLRRSGFASPRGQSRGLAHYSADPPGLSEKHVSKNGPVPVELSRALRPGDRPIFAHRAESSPWIEDGQKLGQSPRSGLCVIRSGDDPRADFALINNHPDPFPNSGHNHASLLQLLLWIDGAPVLIDGGTYRYNDDQGLRDVLRGTMAHNTVVVDGEDQALPARNFGWLTLQRPGGSRLKVTDEYAIFDGWHDSYRRLRQPVRHRRSVVWLKEPRVWIVRDELTGAGRHQFHQMWHFPATRRLRAVGPFAYESHFTGHATVGLQFLAGPDDRVDSHCGSAKHPWSWESPRYGELRPRRSVGLVWEATAPSIRVAAFFDTARVAGPQPVKAIDENRLQACDGRYELAFGPEGVRVRQIESSGSKLVSSHLQALLTTGD